MERLTGRTKAGLAYYKQCFKEPCKGMAEKDCAMCDYQNITVCKKLAAYEDICESPEQLHKISKMYPEKCEELNRLKVILDELRKQMGKFKIGDTAYIVDIETKVINESVINGLVDRIYRNGIEHEYDSDLLYFKDKDIGKTVFLTKEKAELGLKQMVEGRKFICDVCGYIGDSDVDDFSFCPFCGMNYSHETDTNAL